MKEKLTGLLPYAAVLAADFYLLPCLMTDTGTAMLLMLCVMPLTALITAMIYGIRRGFSLLVPAAAMLLFAPSIPLHYNGTAWPYIAVYGIVALAGTGIGRIFYQKR